ncbi:MAG: ATP-binding protein [Planctomycetota bacterium]|nr:MAG: ATP-binding protein [Planctomycetota bacterium]
MSPTAPERWSEVRLEGLVPTEHDTQEFKSSLYVVDSRGAVRTDFLDNLSKQVSAFANAAGGHLFLGIDDRGRIDGGVPTHLRPNGTREWLEDVVPAIVDPPLRRFNVYEVGRSDQNSRIAEGRAVYVVEIRESEDAPHMARDRRYYLRIAGKSRPMGHRHVLDVLNRRRDPEVRCSRIDPYGDLERIEDDPRGPKVLLRLRGTLVNEGRALAQHVGLEFVLPRVAVNSLARQRTLNGHPQASLSQRPGEVTFFFYHPTPIFPQQELSFGEVWVAVHSANVGHYAAGRIGLRWRVYADAAVRQEGEVDLSAFSAVRRGIRWLRRAGGVRG